MPQALFVAPERFVNPEHFKFALKGGLAASLCYIVYNSIAWPGISTAVTTCMLTGLSTIGASRQKQVLRLAGAVVGGCVIGMGSQIFILPHLDSIAGFTLLFVAVTALASWFMTSSPRLSYFGVAGGPGFLPHQPAGVRDTDVALRGKGPRRRHSAGTLHDVARIRPALGSLRRVSR